MKSLSTFLFSSVVAFGLLFAVGCDSSSSNTDGENGSLELSMNDGSSTARSTKASAQDSITSAEVTITEISVVPAEDTAEGDSTETGISVLSDENFEVDLMNLQERLNDTLIADTEIPTGDYEQIRLAIPEGAAITYANGDTDTAMIASNGLKVVAPFTIDSAEDRVSVVLNWNVDKFAQDILRGNSQGRLVITPVIQATVNTETENDGS